MTTGFENHGIVPVTDADRDREILHDSLSQQFNYPECKLPDEIEEIVQHRLEEEKSAIASMAVTRLIAEILDHENKELTAIAIGCAVGMSLMDGRSLVDFAKERGITRAALSKRVVEVTERLGLQPARGMKSIKARRIYSARQKRIHEKNRKPKQAASGAFFERFGHALKRA